jgi:hypothetical protein
VEIVNLSVPDGVDFKDAGRIAEKKARERLGKNPVLWSWCDAAANLKSPSVDCCASDDEPAWELYGRVRGAKLKVAVNGGEYQFCFGPPFPEDD